MKENFNDSAMSEQLPQGKIVNKITKEQFSELGFEPHYSFPNTFDRIVKTKSGDKKYQLGYVPDLGFIGLHYFVYESPTNMMQLFHMKVGNFDELKFLIERCLMYQQHLSQQGQLNTL